MKSMHRTERWHGGWCLVWAACGLFIFALPVEGGFSCLSNPCFNGICIDDVNSTFSCYCIDGFTGVLCQTNWDECWSNPCMNGGTCEDGIADYNCTCPSGFQGEICEENVNECESNPCHNNGTCIDGNDSYTCFCHAGFSGQYCEEDISVCNSTDEARCENGGICLDGLGHSFHCMCPTGWEGVLCENAVDECASSPCKNGGVCVDHHANYTCACAFGYSGKNCEVILEICGEDNPCENDALCLIEDWMNVCYCVPDFHGERCEFQYDECLLGPGCKNGGTCIDGIDSYTCSCPPNLVGMHCECLVIDENMLNCSYIAPTNIPTSSTSTSTSTEIAPTTSTEIAPTTTTTASSPVPTHVPTTTEILTTTPSTEEPTPESTEAISTTEEAVTTELIAETATEIESTTEEQEAATDWVTTEFFTKQEVTTRATTESAEGRTEPPTTEASVLQTTSELFFPTEDAGSATEQAPNCRKIPCLNGGMCLNTSQGLKCVCKTGWEGEQCEKQPSIQVAAFSGQSYVSHRVSNTSHLKVDITARTAAVAGSILHSSLAPGVYMTLYLDDGLLKFKFSCGLQTMLLSEVQFHINNGFDLLASVTLDFLPSYGKNSHHCVATVRVNNTLAMSGEQMSVAPPVATESEYGWLFLGGLPENQRGDLPPIEGFVGCMHNLTVNGEPKSIYEDGVVKKDIRECLSMACLSSPCHNGGSCVDRNSSWECLCSSGYLGEQCEKSVCENNPCEYGGSCVIFPGSGFICLCPLGKHGQFCEYDLDIGQPMFSSTVAGLASFSAHLLPTEIHQHIVFSFKFIPHDMEQISLMMFMGQNGQHGPGSDHLAVSFIKGFIVLTWNLGSGPRRIFTSRPIEDTGHRPHVVQIGREGQQAWLFVDNLGNVTGKSPGSLTQLNTRSIVYLGGHDSGNFSLLPHDLPLHTGFSGCLYDARLQTGHMMIMLQQTKATMGRSVGQCGTSLCHEHACQNGGGCIHHGATFTCLCADGWFGPSCGLRHNPCDSSRHNCSNGSTCVPMRDGYSCDCPLGMMGTFCEQNVSLSDVRFSGIRSYLGLQAEGLFQHRACIDMEIMATSHHGLLLYSGRSDASSFLSLSLHGGLLELRVTPGPHRRQGEPLVIRSRRLVSLGRWHRIRAARFGRRLFLWVEGTVNSGTLLPGETLPPPSSLLYLGGVPDLSNLPPGTMAAHVTSFQGCIRRFSSQWRSIQLNASSIVTARNIADCDGTACGGDLCAHGGTCSLNSDNSPVCDCTKEYTGKHCETMQSCLEIGCRNGGSCLQEKGPARCSCPVGKGGPFCETDTSAEVPYFGGDSYMVIDRMVSASPSKQLESLVGNSLVEMAVDFIYINFTTAAPNGLLLWTSRHQIDEYLGVGIEDGFLKIVWAYEGKPALEVMGGVVSDGIWHDLAVSLDTANVSVWADHKVVTTQPLPSRPLATDGRFFLGGFPRGVPISETTFGHFSDTFQGCLQKLAWGVESVIKNFSSFQGENVGVCNPFEK